MTKPNWPTFSPEESELDTLVKLSRYYGANPEFVLAGGGNTSVKTDDTLYVKASGTSLAEIDRDGFVALRRDRLQAVLEGECSDDPRQRETQFRKQTLASRVDPEGGRPSVESVFHHVMPGRYVVHTHAVQANVLGSCTRGEQLAREWFGEDVVWIDYYEPGIRLAKRIQQALAEFRENTGRDCPTAVIMQNHGVIVCGNTAEEIRERTDRLIETVREQTADIKPAGAFGPGEPMDEATARVQVLQTAPVLRALLAETDRLKVVTFDDSDFAVQLASGTHGKGFASKGPLGPDQIVYAGSWPLWFEPGADETPTELIQRLGEAIEDYRQANNLPPKVVILKGIGILAAGDSWADADTARQVYLNAATVMATAEQLGGVRGMTDEERGFIEGWEAESYRARVASPQTTGRAAGKVAIVTGAARGFGLEISQDLAAQDAHVVLADLNDEGARDAAREIAADCGRGRAIGTAVNVTDAESIREAIWQTIRMYGGFDLFVANAGVLKAGSIKTLPEKDFDFVTAVNYKGYFLSVQNAAPVLALQHAAKGDYRSDIIQINSKSGLDGSNKNGAYAGGKFGGIGLTQSVAKELVTDGIKVNSICPGNFFEGPLWSDPETGLFAQYLRTGKVPGAKTVEDVKTAYEAKVPMGRGCRTADVMKAIYYCLDQQYETGQAIPVTGGQVMLK